MSNYGRETVVLVELDQPLCAHEYGDAFASPSGSCTAQLGVDGERKCYNTRATCQDAPNYSAGTLTLRFARSQEALTRYYGYVIPSVEAISTTPAAINLAAMESSAAALGQREVVQITLQDHLSSDLLLDKYRLQRASGAAAAGSPVGEQFDPYRRGTFWSKWLARNPYHVGYPIRIYQGFLGDAIESMRVRHYIVDRIDGPTEGRVTIIAKDLFSRIEARKAVAPRASRGELAADLTGTPGSFTVTPADIMEEDYQSNAGSPTELYVAIKDEVIRCTRSGATFNILERGAFNTTQDDHDEQDLVQLVLFYDAELSHDIVYDLLVNYSGIDPDLIDKARWDVLAANISNLYTGRICEPKPVNELIGELCEQVGFTVWPNVSTGMIEYAPLRAAIPAPTVTDDAWTVEGSLSLKRQVAKRASQIWVYYGQVNPTESLDDRRNYHSRLVVADLEAEGEDQYGQPSIRTVFSRWIPQFGRDAAEQCGERMLAMFRDPPLEARFTIHASRDGELQLARYFYLDAAEVCGVAGESSLVAMATIALELGESEIEVRAQEVTFGDESSSGGSPGEVTRSIYIENDASNLNLRTIHDSLYAAPAGDEVIRFVVLADVNVSSASTGSPAIRTGSWPAMSTPPLLTFEDPGSNPKGRIQGAGGAGGIGQPSIIGAPPPGNGSAGGLALLVESPFQIDAEFGEIWAGAGGGGGGGQSDASGTLDAGGGGGGGAGNVGGGGGAPGNPPAFAGATGTKDSAGAGGEGDFAPDTRGGNGGAPALPGSPGSAGAGGSGGAAGNAVQGDSYVTWINIGDRRGNVV